ncbi:type III secretion system LEE export apparatus switch protein EscU, partial [Escherichia coli]|nr:type III secretion system LEE export apparatus switch protein EscU [Escherichia coli]
MSEKTEKPTPKKLRDLKKKGDVTKSEEVMAAVQSLILFSFFSLYGASFFVEVVELVNTTIDSLNRPFLYAIREILGAVLNIFLLYILPISLIVFVGTVTTGVSQTGFIFAAEKIKPSAQKISVKNNLKNIFSVKSIFELLKSVFKLVIITLIFYFMGHSYANEFANFTRLNAYQTLVVVAFFVFLLWKGVLFGYLLFSVFDFWFQKHEGLKKMKMSKDEVKREAKDTDGNPEIKGERRRLHSEIQSGSLANNIKKSTVIVKNPTHIAICLYYKLGETPLPLVIETGKDAKALQIIKLAELYDIPVIEDIPLARSLYKNIHKGQYIT